MNTVNNGWLKFIGDIYGSCIYRCCKSPDRTEKSNIFWADCQLQVQESNKDQMTSPNLLQIYSFETLACSKPSPPEKD